MYEISKHAKERYAERIMDKSSVFDVSKFILENDEKIKTDINKMIEYGTQIYSGKQKRENRTSVVSVYVKDLWIVLCDKDKNLVITLYKVDLGLDEEFNKIYVEKMLAQLSDVKLNLDQIILETEKQNSQYLLMIEENTETINEYKTFIKNLEKLNDGYQSVINNNYASKLIAQKEVTDVLNKLIGKKEF